MWGLVVVSSSWDIGTFLQNSTETIKEWIGYGIVLGGVVMIGIAVYQFIKGLASKNQQTNWFVILLLVVFGGAFMAGGWTFVEKIASGGQKTLEDLGQVILPYICR